MIRRVRFHWTFGMLAVSVALFVLSAATVVEAGRCRDMTCADGAECPDLLCGGTTCKCEKISTMCNCLPNGSLEPGPIVPSPMPVIP